MTSTTEQKSHATGQPRKKEVPAFLHDADASYDPKVIALKMSGAAFDPGFERQDRGDHAGLLAAAWCGFFWHFIEQMRRSSDLTIRLTALPAIAYELRVSMPTLQAFVTAAVNAELFERSNEAIWSPSLMRRMDAYAAGLEQKRNAGRASAEARRKRKDPTDVEQPTTDVQQPLPTVEQPSSDAATSADAVQRPLNERSTVVPGSLNGHNKNQNTNSNQNQNENPNPNGNPNTGESPRGECDDPFYLEMAEARLSPPTPDIECDNRYITMGRRPMTAFPEIWLTPIELGALLKKYIEAGIPPEQIKLAFEQATKKLEHCVNATHQSPERIDVVSWLNTFIFRNVIDILTSQNNLARSEIYKQKALGK